MAEVWFVPPHDPSVDCHQVNVQSYYGYVGKDQLPAPQSQRRIAKLTMEDLYKGNGECVSLEVWNVCSADIVITMVNFLHTALLALVASNYAIALPNPITYPVPKPDSIHGTSKYQRRGLTLEGRASRETYANEAVAGINALHKWY